MRKPAKWINTLVLHPKLVLNFLYSIFFNLYLSFRSFFRLKVIADFGSTIAKAPGSRLIIEKRLYLGGQYIGDMASGKAHIRLYREGVFHVRGRVKFGPGVGVVVGPKGRLTIGDNSYITASSVVYCADQIDIGEDCAIAWGATILDTDFHQMQYPDQADAPVTKPVKIGNKVWIGCNSTILKGVTIGDNAVIGANSLVNRDIPANCLAAGNPARILKDNIDWTP
jgi:acetyltransferase-like isoleucine patch superfamily enzyme